jgi:hypothetical protein
MKKDVALSSLLPVRIAGPCAGLLVALSLSWVSLPARADIWGEAQEAFAEYDDARGLWLLAQAAEAGDVRAMRALGLALRHGPRLFPVMQRADLVRSAYWLNRARAVCVAAPAMHCLPLQPQALENRR